MTRLPQDAAASERRTQVRIRVEIPVKVLVRGLDEPLIALTRDLSWGGILFTLSQPLPLATRSLRIVLPWRQGEAINVLAAILRTKVLQDGRLLVGARFASLSPRGQSRLERLLKTLGDTLAPVDKVGPTELVRELEVNANDTEELRRILAAIASGRHSLTVFEAYAYNQSLCFSLAGTEQWSGIRLRARVVEVKPTSITGFDAVPLHDVTLAFEHPKEALEKLIQFLLGQLSDAGQAPALPKGAPRSLAPVSPEPSRKPPLASPLRCTLELDFPEALSYLTLGWGDVETFGMLFRELTLGERFHSGGWPSEAWEELSLLGDVHDQAYGRLEADSHPPIFGGS
ncbi:PilZ domain-containing protein [Thiocystis violacea]|uniref:PilZ domain-containing protein n=1 Tax=Thiocystis violacea TaxID=13725 RepID=UPI001906D78D|nr:PilZ domain-containing protein [Thiocystis violacea]